MLAAPSFAATRAQGPMLGSDDVATYPEAGLGGPYPAVDLANEVAFATHFSSAAVKTFRSRWGRPFSDRLHAISFSMHGSCPGSSRPVCDPYLFLGRWKYSAPPATLAASVIPGAGHSLLIPDRAN